MVLVGTADIDFLTCKWFVLVCRQAWSSPNVDAMLFTRDQTQSPTNEKYIYGELMSDAGPPQGLCTNHVSIMYIKYIKSDRDSVAHYDL